MSEPAGGEPAAPRRATTAAPSGSFAAAGATKTVAGTPLAASHWTTAAAPPGPAPGPPAQSNVRATASPPAGPLATSAAAPLAGRVG